MIYLRVRARLDGAVGSMVSTGRQDGDRHEELDRVTEVSVTIEQDFRLVSRRLRRRAALVYHDVGWRVEPMVDWNGGGA